MARRGSSLLVVGLLCLTGLWAFAGMTANFVQAPPALRGSTPSSMSTEVEAPPAAASAMMLGLAAATVPQAASAATAGYAFQQIAWALFLISLGPAFLVWVYYNRPDLL